MDINKKVGIVEWFPASKSWNKLEQTVEDMRKIGVSHLRTGFSWTEYLQDPYWFDEKFYFLSKNLIDVLPCFLYTPPKISRCGEINCAPENLKGFAEFINEAIIKYPQFRAIQLWNEHNDPDWNRNEDPYGVLFSEMIRIAAKKAKTKNVKTVLGGMDRYDKWWWSQLVDNRTFDDIDIIGFNSVANMSTKRRYGIPKGWLTEKHPPWDETIKGLVEPIYKSTGKIKPVWVAELAYSTMEEEDFFEQGRHLARAIMSSSIDRVYFYSIRDMDLDVVTLREKYSGNRCEFHYNLGAFYRDGTPKMLGDVWQKEGLEGVVRRFS